MNILIIAPEYPPSNIGGGGHLIEALTHGLEKIGSFPTVVSARCNTHSFFDRPFETNFGKTVILWLPLIPSPRVGFQLKTYLPPNLFSVFELLRIILRKEFDIIHIHGFGHFFCDFAAILCKLSGKPYLHTIHGFPKEPKKRGGLLQVLYGIYCHILGYPAVRGASRIVAVSGDLAKECKIYFPQKEISVIPNGIDRRYCFQPSALKMQKIVAKFRLQEKKIILGLGRLCKGKGYQYAIMALPSVLAKIAQAHLVIAGIDDGYGYSLELSRLVERNGVKSHVSFVGRITDNDEKSALLWQADVVIIPSLEESFGLVALEALGSGRPIVASRVGGLSEILATDKYSRLVEAGNVKELAAALIDVMNNPELRCGARRNRILRLSPFDLNHMVHSYADLYVSLKNDAKRAV